MQHRSTILAACFSRKAAVLLVALAVLLVARGAPATEPPARAPTRFQIRGCWSCLDLFVALVREFDAKGGRSGAEFIPHGSAVMLRALQRHEIDVGVTLRCLCPNDYPTLEKEYEQRVLGDFVLVFLVHPQNHVGSMTFQELKDIFTAKTTSWDELPNSGLTGPIEVRIRTRGRTEGTIVQEKVMDGYVWAQYAPHFMDGRLTEVINPLEIAPFVAKHRQAIGLLQFSPGDELDKRLRAIGVARKPGEKPVSLTAESVLERTYPVMDTVSLWIRPDAPPMAREFCDFVSGPEGAKVIRDFGMFPEYDRQQVLGKRRLAEMKVGKGDPVAVVGVKGGEELMRALAEAYVREKAVVQARYQAAGRDDAVARFVGQGAGGGEQGGELLLLDRPMDEETRKKWAGKGEEGQRIPDPSPPTPLPKGEGRGARVKGEGRRVGRRAVGVVVHVENPLAAMTLEELREVFSGKVDRWPRVQGAEPKIKLFGLAAGDPLAALFEEKVGPLASGGKIGRRPDSAKVLRAVAADRAAIGFVDLAAVGAEETGVKVLAVSRPGAGSREPGAMRTPSLERLPDDYPLATEYTLYVSPKAGQAARALAAHLTPTRIAAAVRSSGFAPPAGSDLPAALAGPAPVNGPTQALGPNDLSSWKPAISGAAAPVGLLDPPDGETKPPPDALSRIPPEPKRKDSTPATEAKTPAPSSSGRGGRARAENARREPAASLPMETYFVMASVGGGLALAAALVAGRKRRRK